MTLQPPIGATQSNWQPKVPIQNALDAYLEKLKGSFFEEDDKYTESNWETYQESLSRHLGRLENFLSGSQKRLQNLGLKSFVRLKSI